MSFEPTAPADLDAATRVVRDAGAAGMGEVYEVVDEELGVTVALKTVPP